jgi:transcriptional regulator with XRE-family HTH domain
MELSEKLKSVRRINGLSQEGLAEISGVSIRTIQRIEKNLSIGSAYTLSALAKALNVTLTDLMPQESSNTLPIYVNSSLLKLLNLSALCVILIPLANIIIPAIIFWRHKGTEAINIYGRKILSFQILWMLSTLLLMVIIPAVMTLLFESVRGPRIPLFVPVYFTSVIFNVYMTIRFALSLNGHSNKIESLPNIL